MVSGRVSRSIQDIRPGDEVLGIDGRSYKVFFVEQKLLGDRKLYGLAGRQPFVTSEHPFLTALGLQDPGAPRYALALKGPLVALTPQVECPPRRSRSPRTGSWSHSAGRALA
jgi:hypothetical protein